MVGMEGAHAGRSASSARALVYGSFPDYASFSNNEIAFPNLRIADYAFFVGSSGSCTPCNAAMVFNSAVGRCNPAPSAGQTH
jgi:hypothetical protein